MTEMQMKAKEKYEGGCARSPGLPPFLPIPVFLSREILRDEKMLLCLLGF